MAAAPTTASNNTTSDSPKRETDLISNQQRCQHSRHVHILAPALLKSIVLRARDLERKRSNMLTLTFMKAPQALELVRGAMRSNERRIKELETVFAAGRESLNDIHAKFREVAHVNEVKEPYLENHIDRLFNDEIGQALLGDLEALQSVQANKSVQMLRQKLEERKAAMEEKANTLVQPRSASTTPSNSFASQPAESTPSLSRTSNRRTIGSAAMAPTVTTLRSW
ncbi:hypothetical protein BJ742DRAFT_768093 [Cladochytrium replicatum]|nr:hypothetical protein BJ742DRAFT_768093 [Cladochytrium replicatum]